VSELKLKISPSILSADFGKLNEEIKQVEGLVELLHVDVMDGHFVPNITIGAPVVKKIKTSIPLDVHLMIEQPEKYLKDFAEAGAHIICVHAEAVSDLKQIVEQIKALGVKAAVSIKPKTPLSAVDAVLDDVDMVLIMSVEPGFGGQGFMPEVLPKVKELREKKPELDIQVDGGITKENIKQAVEAGANVFVAGSSIFGKPDRAQAIKELREAAE
jgi:ribulose-phosphate 3-epimerase